MSDKEFTIQDMVGAISNESPSEFQNAFADLVLDKIAAAVDAKRQEVAQNYFNTASDESAEETEEEQAGEDNEENTDENTQEPVGEEG